MQHATDLETAAATALSTKRPHLSLPCTMPFEPVPAHQWHNVVLIMHDVPAADNAATRPHAKPKRREHSLQNAGLRDVLGSCLISC